MEWASLCGDASQGAIPALVVDSVDGGGGAWVVIIGDWPTGVKKMASADFLPAVRTLCLIQGGTFGFGGYHFCSFQAGFCPSTVEGPFKEKLIIQVLYMCYGWKTL